MSEESKEIENLQNEVRTLRARLDEVTRLEAHHRDAEEELHQKTRLLGKRVKELRCLYEFSKITSQEEWSVETIFQRTLAMLPEAMQYPESACARLFYMYDRHQSEGFEESSWRLRQPICIFGVERGSVEIFYKKEYPAAYEGPFLCEEKELVEAVAERLGKFIERAQTKAELERIQSQRRAILDNIPDMAWTKDVQSRFIAVNEAFGRACGVLPADLEGKTDLDIWPKKLAEQYRADDREVVNSGRRKQVEEPLTDKT